MQAILYVGHGSRVQAGNDELLAFVEKAKSAQPNVAIQECCFLELAEPTIDQGVESCIKQGATDIAVLPVLLLTAGHAKVDIPEAIDEIKRRYPHITFTYGKPIGVEQTVVHIIQDRLAAAGLKLGDDRPRYEDRQPVSILLVGRGSSDPDNTSDLMKIARLVWEYTPVSEVEVCFLAAAHPTVEEGLQRLQRFEFQTTYVVPYLLFTGVLMKSLQEMLDDWSEMTDRTFILCNYLGFDDQLIKVLARRAEEVLNDDVQVSCDTCQFRLAYANNGG
ncbi:sirohydrochlorin chelatase [Halalkalibacter sp. APA_J-10(15)]|uniref:sirohydrochlorin chelatase n=1 Tax=Halalkalibacter sp. APA_J-10(15) TaxID=2933805 RepID=UPI001FF598B6|nr:sirohydrochlorin chelatase [Halalkalibacter sp. APA_J-10(15)]MCK0471455.1 sirohydrochlorin chelatase [Halalkalibacter sp. APA_J-10(15)]